jgi:hypothetical protein
MEISISGGSDDLIEIFGCEGEDEFCNASSGIVKLAGNFIAPDGKGMRVHALYDGTWSFALGLLDEDHEWADWPVVIEQGDRPYNTLVRVEAPEGTKFVLDDKYHSAR